jgi:3-phenylpropionate/trans-cinnamate dioxygenase ferredoxin reductase subunit
MSMSSTPVKPVAPVETVVVVGASRAGLSAAEALRDEGYDGRVVLLGDEAALPYDRPPLSKEVLSGAWNVAQTQLATHAELAARGIELRTSARATSLDLAAKSVIVNGTERIGFDRLLIATGARARMLPGSDLEGIHCLRTIDDALAIRAQLAGRPRVTVVGAGFIGAEVVSTLSGLGLEVSLVHLEQLPMEIAVGVDVATRVQRMQRDSGARIYASRMVESFRGRDRVEAVVLRDGTVIETDVVVVGAGVVPNVEWLRSSGLPLDAGVVCDEFCAADAERGVYVAGDVASGARRGKGLGASYEHWTNAVDQGAHAARNLLTGDGRRSPYTALPYFWSDQFGVRIQVLGQVPPGVRLSVVDGSIDDLRFAGVYHRDGHVTGAVALNMPSGLVRLARQVTQRAPFTRAEVEVT